MPSKFGVLEYGPTLLGTQAEGLQVVGVPPRAAAYLEHRASRHDLGDPPEEGLECRVRGPLALT